MAGSKLGWGYHASVWTLKPLQQVFVRRDWRGHETIPREGGLIIVANHISMFDPVAMAHFVHDAGRAPRFLAKSSLFDVPVVGAVLSSARQIPVYRKSRDAAKAFSAAVDAVRAGECVVIYPEGTVTRDPGHWPQAGKSGAARIALATGAPVIPVAQWGAQRILPVGAKVPRLLPRHTISMLVGSPVVLDDLRAGPMTAEAMRAANVRIMSAITAQLEQLRGEKAPEQRAPLPEAPTGEPA